MVETRANDYEGGVGERGPPPSPSGWGSAVRELLSGRHEKVVYGIFLCFLLWTLKDTVLFLMGEEGTDEK